MKNLNRKVASLLIAIVVLSAAASAQYAHMILKVDVPFEFVVGRQTFPAGTYWITRNGPHTLVLRDKQNKFLALIAADYTETRTPHATSSLRFKPVDGHLALAEVWQGGTGTGFALHPDKRRATAVAQQHSAGSQAADIQSVATK